jgi:hypothetical protein
MTDKKKLSGFADISAKIVEGIRIEANTKAVDVVVNKRVEAEVTRRADILEKAMDKYSTLIKELKSIKPDVITHSVVEDVNTKREEFSDVLFKKRVQLQKTKAEFDVAFVKAFSDKPEDISEGYQKLQGFSNQGGGDKNNKGKSEPAE